MLATPDVANDNVCFAPHDVDGDGKVDFAVGHDWQFNNSDSGGHIGWLHSPSDPREMWTYRRIAEEPTTHRMRWVDWDHDGQSDLVVAPLKGKHSKAPASPKPPYDFFPLLPIRRSRSKLGRCESSTSRYTSCTISMLSI